MHQQDKSKLHVEHSQQQQQLAAAPVNFYLMRVTAPRGLKILDAPQFQVNHLIRNNTTGSTKNGKKVSSTSLLSHMSKPELSKSQQQQQMHHSSFQTMSGRLTTTSSQIITTMGNPAVFDVATKSRILPRNALFEASKRMVDDVELQSRCWIDPIVGSYRMGHCPTTRRTRPTVSQLFGSRERRHRR